MKNNRIPEAIESLFLRRSIINTPSFHIKQISGRHFLFTPREEPFISLGINHVGAISEEDPFDLFKSKYHQNWDRVSQAAVQNFQLWGFNTAGYHSPFELHKYLPFMTEAYPYPAPIAYWMPETHYPDVFDPKWESEVRGTIDLMCLLTRKNVGNLIGYYWTDTPRWDLHAARKLIGSDWVSHIRALPEASPGKKRYLDFLMEQYADTPSRIESLYGLPPESRVQGSIREPFMALDLNHPQIREDDQTFLRLIARKYYQVLGQATREADPGRLIFGDRYLGGDHPEEVIAEALPWIDVLSVQPLGVAFEEDLFDRLYEITQKPILICDHQSSFYTTEYPNTMWNQLPSEAEAANAYYEYLTSAFKKPYIIGYHRCQYIDRFDRNNNLLKQGLIREDETPYHQLVAQVKLTNQSLKPPYPYR